MASRLKTTGFARFFIFLLIAAPMIYSGVALFNGENPIDSVKRDLGIVISNDTDKEEREENETAGTENLKSKLYDQKEEISNLQAEVKSLKRDLENCQSAKAN